MKINAPVQAPLPIVGQFALWSQPWVQWFSDVFTEAEQVRDTTVTLTGVTTTVTGTAREIKRGKTVTLQLPALSGTSNSAAATVTGISADYAPASSVSAPAIVTNNGTQTAGLAVVGSDGTITLYTSAALGTFTGAGTKGVARQCLTWTLA